MAQFVSAPAKGQANVLMLTRRNAVVHATSGQAVAGNCFANLAHGTSNLIFKASNNDNFQTFVENSAVATINGVDYSVNGVATVERNFSKAERTNVLILTGDGSINFEGYELNQRANANIQIRFNGTCEGFVTLKVSKQAGFNDPDTQQLQARDRIPF